MSFANKLENTYLNILRYVILIVATISMLVVIIAGGMALSAAFSSPPKAPEQIKFEDRANDLKDGFNLKNFKNDNQPKAEDNSQKQAPAPPEKPRDDAFQQFIKSSVSKIADNIIAYQKTVKNIDLNKDNVENIIGNIPFNAGLRKDKAVYTFYFETLILLSGELAKQAPEIAKLSEDKKIDVEGLFKWHMAQVNNAIKTIDDANAQRQAEFQEKQTAYAAKTISIYKFATIAGAAFGIFLFIIMLFVMVKIEINLRPLQQIADNGKSSTT